MLTETKGYNTHTGHLDLSGLSKQARQELLDFYQFLLERYGIQQQTRKSLPSIFYKPVKTQMYQPFDRHAIYDSSGE
jgi:hypothetical protein